MTIELMPDGLSNKIAAGEVVERPASVVKELVENSLDANSSVIKIEVYEAGLGRIKITDDGDGMNPHDADLAFLRHATSKVKSEQDLFHVKTLGFRGEALASIAAVSKLTLKTSTGEEAGVTRYLEGGKEIKRDKADARKGTEITVDQLFFNTPARLKYMKTIHTELGHITDIVNRLSLSHPHVRVSLYHNDKALFQSSGRGDRLQIMAQIYGVAVAKKMIKIEHNSLDFAISGYICKPEVTRTQRHYMSTLVNGRFVKSVPINKAILSGYHTLLPIGRYPIVVINIEMDPILVDVNVHPTKLDVRFSKEKELFLAIETAIKTAFKKEQLIPEHVMQKPKKEKNQQQHFYLEHQSATESSIQKSLDFLKPLDQATDNQANEEHSTYSSQDPDQKKDTFQASFTQQNDEDRSPLPLEGEEDNLSAETLNDQQKQTVDSNRLPVMYPVGQHHGTYIIAENENGLYLIDQHAAQERMKYEYYREKIVEVDPNLQELLVPFTFDFSKQEALIVEEHREKLEAVGVFFEPFGQSTYLVRAHPQWFPTGFEEESIRDIVAQVMDEEAIDLKKLREDAAIMMSCKQSIKANHHLSHDDMFRLLEDLRRSSDPFTCPHGRPIIIHFTGYELEKMFKRVM